MHTTSAEATTAKYAITVWVFIRAAIVAVFVMAWGGAVPTAVDANCFPSPLRRLVLNQDRGAAITGPARVDIHAPPPRGLEQSAASDIDQSGYGAGSAP